MNKFREGVYFSMSAEEYHSVPALSASGMKHLRTSPLDFWVRSPHNPNLATVQAEEASSEAKEIGRAFHCRIVEGRDAFAQRYAEEFSCPQAALRTIDDIKKRLRELDLPLNGNKPELIERLIAKSPTEQIADLLERDHAKTYEGKVLLSGRWLDKIEIAAAMIEQHPQLSKAFSGGAPEVSIVWTCPIIGVNCKARLDYLKPKAIVDLKTLQNTLGRPLDRAVAYEFASRRYFTQAAFYMEAAAQVARLIREGKGDLKCEVGLDTSLRCDHKKTFLFVWQIKGVAPAAIGRVFNTESLVMQAAKAEIEHLKQVYRSCLDKFGPDMPWVEDSQIAEFADEEVPPWAMQ